jgi:hypothetical protein
VRRRKISPAIGALDFDEALVGAWSTFDGLYQQVLVEGVADPSSTSCMGAALAAQQALLLREDELRRQNLGAYSRAVGELNRFVALFPSREPPDNPATYQQVLVQGSRVRLALSPYL